MRRYKRATPWEDYLCLLGLILIIGLAMIDIGLAHAGVEPELPGVNMRHIVRHWIDAEKNLVTIEIDEVLASGSDGACHIAGKLFHSICRLGFDLLVLPPAGRAPGDNFVPSRVNPMDAQWTRYLVGNQDWDE
ncbi:MAG: hypothetical protein JEZ11_03930 [Desulfobacterales bacterium]|nr:hypothetical protein [Desulfobacterales bacterium]